MTNYIHKLFNWVKSNDAIAKPITDNFNFGKG